MSKGYGWQCESAIIPKSHSRAINNVDSRSLLALKALATSSTTGTSKRKAISEFDLPSKSRIFDNNKNNKISKKNTEQDSKSGFGRNGIKSKEDNNKQDEKESQVYASLLAKAKAYDEIVTGCKDSRDVYSSKEDESVIDFYRKRELDNGDSTTIHSIPVPPPIAEDSAQWNWSRTDHRPTRSMTSSKVTYITASEAKVKTQWDKVLGSSAKEYLQEIHQTTVAGRDHTAADTGGEAQKDSAREQRMQLLRQKQTAAAAAKEAPSS